MLKNLYIPTSSKKMLKYILFIIIILLILIFLLNISTDNLEKKVNIDINNNEWVKIVSYGGNLLIPNDTVSVSFDSNDKSLYNTAIELKLIEHTIWGDDKEFIDIIKPNDTFSMQISSGNSFTIYAMNSTNLENLNLNFFISFTEY